MCEGSVDEARAAGAVRTAVSVYVLPRARGAVCTRQTTPQPCLRPRGPAGPAQADSLRSGDWGSVSVRKRGSPAVALATLPDHFLHVCVARAMLGTRCPRPPGLLWAFCVDSPRPRGGRAVGPGHGRRLRASEPPGKRQQCDLLPRMRRGRSGACRHQQGGCPALGSALRSALSGPQAGVPGGPRVGLLSPAAVGAAQAVHFLE